MLSWVQIVCEGTIWEQTGPTSRHYSQNMWLCKMRHKLQIGCKLWIQQTFTIGVMFTIMSGSTGLDSSYTVKNTDTGTLGKHKPFPLFGNFQNLTRAPAQGWPKLNFDSMSPRGHFKDAELLGHSSTPIMPPPIPDLPLPSSGPILLCLCPALEWSIQRCQCSSPGRPCTFSVIPFHPRGWHKEATGQWFIRLINSNGATQGSKHYIC